MCIKGEASLEILTHSDRLKTPLKRKGERGQGRWETIPWDEALDILATHLAHARATNGAPSVAFIHGAAKGLRDSYLARFANLF